MYIYIYIYIGKHNRALRPGVAVEERQRSLECASHGRHQDQRLWHSIGVNGKTAPQQNDSPSLVTGLVVRESKKTRGWKERRSQVNRHTTATRTRTQTDRQTDRDTNTHTHTRARASAGSTLF